MIAMTNDMIRAAAPAVFATEKAVHLSPAYNFINTAHALDVLRGEGYAVVQAKQDNPRSRSAMHVRHALVLRHESALDQKAVVGEVVPQILMINSHNGRTQLSMRAGLYRFVCANGMVVGDDMMSEAIRHSNKMAEELVARIRRSAELAGKTFAKIDQWKAIELSDSKMHDFARAAANLRFGEERAKAYATDALLEVRRPEDEGRTLWTVFNRVQENTTTQSLRGRNASNRDLRSRALTGIGENTKFNEMLWNLGEQFAAV